MKKSDLAILAGIIGLNYALWRFAGWMEFSRKWRFPWEEPKRRFVVDSKGVTDESDDRNNLSG